MKDLEELISRFIDNELNSEERQKVLSTMKNDPSAQKILNNFMRINKEAAKFYGSTNLPSLPELDQIKLEKPVEYLTNIKKDQSFIMGVKVATVSIISVCIIIISLILSQNRAFKPDIRRITKEVISIDDQVEMIFGNKLDKKLDEIELQLQQININ